MCRFPNLPCLVESKMTKAGRRQNYYPIEVCRIMKYQRVTVKQQSPDLQKNVSGFEF